MHAVKERDDGIVVRGARLVSTGAAFSNVTYVSQYIPITGLAGNEEDFALAFFVPFNAPGIKFIGRYISPRRSARPSTIHSPAVSMSPISALCSTMSSFRGRM